MFRTATLIATLAIAPTLASANDYNIPGPDNAAPPVFETFFSLRDDGMSYVMRYVNLQTSGSLGVAEFEDLEIGTVSWQIERTSNEPCAEIRNNLTCADTINVMPPPGYIAIPGTQTVSERNYVDILIVPDAMS